MCVCLRCTGFLLYYDVRISICHVLIDNAAISSFDRTGFDFHGNPMDSRGIFSFFGATLLLLAFGNSISHAINNYFPALQDATLLVISIRASSAMCILILFFLYMYVVIPNHKSNVLAELPGAIASAAGWIGFSYLYSFYIDHMGNFSNTYGSLTAIVLLMLWIYFCMYMLLIGGEINVFIQSAYNEKKRNLS